MPSPSGCHVMAKPSSSKCNLDCSYCFYLEKEKLYPNIKQRYMSDNTLKVYIRQQIEAQEHGPVVFAWQGGEPTLMGLDFFEKAVRLQHEYAAGKSIENTFQTNGLLIDENWCRFFHDHQFLVGISIDGPEHLHDAYRKTRAQKGTYKKVVNAIELMQRCRVDYNTLTVVSDANYSHGVEVYEHLKSLGSDVHQYIPLIERKATQQTHDGLTLISPEHTGESKVASWSVPESGYGIFLADIFDHWVIKDVGKIFVPIFENILAAHADERADMCTLAKSCGSAFALEANGDLYACDHYVYPEHKLGNIHQTTIKAMNQSLQNVEFGLHKHASLSNDCRRCPFLRLCHGGCPKHRFMPSSSGKLDQSYLCSSYKQLFSRTDRKMKMMVNLWNSGFALDAIMAMK